MSLTKEQRAANIASGLCNCCTSKGCSATHPQPARPGKRSCAECADARKKQVRKQRGRLKRMRRCACGEPRRVGFVNCAECAKAEAVKREQKMAELRMNGICPRCCKRPVCQRPPRKRRKREGHPVGPRAAQFNAPTMTECAECRVRRLEHARMRRQERKNAPRTLEEIARMKPVRKPYIRKRPAQKTA